MNRYQKVTVIVAAVNLLVMLLFPPFLDNPLRVGAARNFDGFFPIFTAWGLRPVHKEMLTLELIFVAANGLAAWLALNSPTAETRRPRLDRGLFVFASVNLGIVLLFPPFEHYSSLVRIATPGFDSFYFVLGDKMHRSIFLPLLYLEVILVVTNLLTLWLLFGAVERSLSTSDEHLLELAHRLPTREAEEVSRIIEARLAVHDRTPPPSAHVRLGSGPDRRHQEDASYHGPERRSGFDRRHHRRDD